MERLPRSFFEEAGGVTSPYEAAAWWLSEEPHHFTEADDPWAAYDELYPYAIDAGGGSVCDEALANVHRAQRLMRSGPIECFADIGISINRAVDMCLNALERERRAGHHATARRMQAAMDAARAARVAQGEAYLRSRGRGWIGEAQRPFI